MSDKFKSTKRCYLIDHHSPQPPAVPLNHLDIAEYDRFFETAHIDSLMYYCKDHWGVTYYDSRVPGARKHAGVPGNWLGRIRRCAAEKDIEFVAYYCIEYDEGAARLFPEWRVQKADGTPLIRDDIYAKWSLVCYQTGYRAYAMAQLKEIVEQYRPDALFLDIFGASLCYCGNCRTKFRSRFGYDLPETQEGLQAHRGDVSDFLDHNAEEFLDEIRTSLKAIDPSLAITINFACHYPEYIRRMLDYQYSEPLLKDNWFSSAYARDTACGQYPMLAPGEASAVYNYDKPARYICDLSAIAAQGCRVGMYSGSQHIDGTLEYEEARRLGSAYAELAKLEPWFTGTRRPVNCVGIIQSDISKSAGPDTFVADAILRMKRHSPHTEAILGAMIACEQAKIPYTILPENKVTEEALCEHELILLPEVYVVKPGLARALEAYVHSGGKIIISGRTGTRDNNLKALTHCAVENLTGCRYITEHGEYRQNDWSAYLKARRPEVFQGLLAVTTPPVSEFFIETEPVAAEVLADLVLPCIACSPTEWINWWSPPPGRETAIPAVAVNRLGQGSVIYLAFDYFTMSARETFRDSADFFGDLLRFLDIRPAVRNRTDTPHLLRTAFFEEEDCFQIHQLSTIPNRYQGETIPVDGGTLAFASPVYEACTVYPEHRKLRVTENRGIWHVELPAFTQQQMIICKKGEKDLS